MTDDLWAVVPVKELGQAKQRLAGTLSGALRRELMLAMLEDVLSALSAASGLGGIAIVSTDPAVAGIVARSGATLLREDARDGHTAAVAAAARRLAARGAGMMALPADVPLIQAEDVAALIEAHRHSQGFTIAPAQDERGSNAVLCSPADCVPLRFGEDSFFPHLAAARARGIEPCVLRLPRLALDIDGPEDLQALLRHPATTRAQVLLAQRLPERRGALLASAEAR